MKLLIAIAAIILAIMLFKKFMTGGAEKLSNLKQKPFFIDYERSLYAQLKFAFHEAISSRKSRFRV